MGTTVISTQNQNKNEENEFDKWSTDFDDKQNHVFDQTCKLSEIRTFRTCQPVLASRNIMSDKFQAKTLTNHRKDHDYQLKHQMTYSTNDIRGSLMIPIFNSILTSARVKEQVYSSIQIDPKKFIVARADSIHKEYSFCREIGKGSYGTVFKAESCSLRGQFRAIKKIQKEKMRDKQKLSLINQFEILKKLDHPNIIKLYQIFQDQKYYYVVFEYCSGGDLLDFINKSTLTQDELKDIMIQILSAVQYMHSLSILHRDLKLENIVIVKKNCQNIYQIKIIDFGLSVDLTKSPYPMIKRCAGTLIYMSPEALTGNYTLASDMWSCGIILYMLATKKLPYEYNSEEEVVEKIMKGYIGRKHMHRLDIRLKMLINFLIQTNPKRRYTAKKALRSEWFRRVGATTQSVSRVEIKKAAENLLSYRKKIQNSLVTVVESYLAFKKISQNERQRLANIFREINKNKSGVIDISELKKFYSDYSDNYNEQEVQELMRLIDKNRSGKIDFNEFITALFDRRRLFSQKNLQEVFNYLDADGSGHISKSQLKEALKGVEDEQIDFLCGELDSNQDNAISKSEFIEFIQKEHDM